MNKEVTLVITTCGRTDLLEQTVYTFFKFNTYPIKKTIIIEDSGIPQNFNVIKTLISTPLEIIVNPKNLGQMKSIDIAYSKVDTDYIFHCEEDWEFFDYKFIEKSFEILDADMNIFTVWLRSHNEKKIKSRIERHKTYQLASGDYYFLIEDHPSKLHYGGFTLNPGLRRTVHAKKFYPYAEQAVVVPKTNNKPLIGEVDLKYHYRVAGYRAAIASVETGYMKHIGWARHIPLPWETDQ